jgi:hypothetical protein
MLKVRLKYRKIKHVQSKGVKKTLAKNPSHHPLYILAWALGKEEKKEKREKS